jgi:hypothetical protein
MATVIKGTSSQPRTHFIKDPETDEWMLEGPSDALRVGSVVEVARADGSTTRMVVTEIVDGNGETALVRSVRPATWRKVDTPDGEGEWRVRVPRELVEVAEKGEPVPVVKRDGRVQRVTVIRPLPEPDEFGARLCVPQPHEHKSKAKATPTQSNDPFEGIELDEDDEEL